MPSACCAERGCGRGWFQAFCDSVGKVPPASPSDIIRVTAVAMCHKVLTRRTRRYRSPGRSGPVHPVHPVHARRGVESECDQLQLEAESRVGTTLLDKWHLDALIGIGGMAAVFAATHRNGLRGAVKLLSPPYSHDANTRARFLREGYIANRVDHPGAVRVLDDDTTSDGRAFLVMELLEGHALHLLAEAAGGYLNTARVLYVADQVLDVLAAAHDKGIVHRDIKPENLFLTFEGHVKVLDFGIARMDDERAPAPRTTQSGAQMGTPAFMAPEQARGRWDLVGPQSDIWSLGATMFTLLAGEVVHDEETVAEIVSAAFTKPARSIATTMSGVPKAIADLVDHALALEPAARWSGAREMQAAVRDAYRGIFGEALPLAPHHRTLLFPSHSSVIPLTESIRDVKAPRSSNRMSRTRRFVAFGGAAVMLTLAAVELRGLATESASARTAFASALGDDLSAAARSPRLSRADHVMVMRKPSVVPATPSGTPPASGVAVSSPVLLRRLGGPDLRTLFDRRH
jgi:serine/threonine protein kinase